jgi:hypothetical protein
MCANMTPSQENETVRINDIRILRAIEGEDQNQKIEDFPVRTFPI